MKKLALISLAILALCLPVSAQTYPDYFAGEQIPSGAYGIEIWPSGGFNIPFSFPENVTHYYESILYSTGDSITIQIVCLATTTDGCIASPPTGWGAEGLFYWQEEAGAYARAWTWPESPNKLRFNAWTYFGPCPLDADCPFEGRFSEGCLEAQSACCPWYDFDQCAVYEYGLSFNIPPGRDGHVGTAPQWVESE